MRKRANDAPIIVKKRKKGEHGFHGGNWKVAMADFMTSMFIFFLVMWLLNIVSKEQREGIGNYFSPVSVSASTTGSGGLLSGKSIIAEGTNAEAGGPPQILPGGGAGTGDFPELDLDPSKEDAEPLTAEQLEDVRELIQTLQDALQESQESLDGAEGDGIAGLGQGGSESLTATGQGRQQGVGAGGQAAAPTSGEGATADSDPGQDGLPPGQRVEQTAEGVRITLSDLEGQPMFGVASSAPTGRTLGVLQAIAPQLSAFAEYRLRITGHTDSVPFRGGAAGYSNWELSVDRANAVRRVLVQAGVDPNQIGEITGHGPSRPVNAAQPDAAENRRIEIVLLIPGSRSVASAGGAAAAAGSAVTASPVQPAPPAAPAGATEDTSAQVAPPVPSGDLAPSQPLQAPTRLITR